MGSTSATAQSYNDVNVMGNIIAIGAANGTGQFLSAVGGLNGARRISSVTFDMSAAYSLNVPAQGNTNETATLTTGTKKFYAKTSYPNVTQINKYEFAVSNRRMASNNEFASNTYLGNLPQISEFARVTANAMAQMYADWEFTALQGTYAARTAVGTAEGCGGLVDSTIGITTNKVNASSAALDSDMVGTLLETMADSGTPMQNLCIVAKPTYVNQFSTLYGFAPQDRIVGGVGLKQIFTTFGNMSIIWSNAAPANTVIIADLSAIQLVVQPNQGQDILMREYIDGASAQSGFIEGFIGVDFTHEAYHGKIYGLA
jgi:hypothetical protein